ncbi:MAG: SCO family protein [Myxococcota bacterium]
MRTPSWRNGRVVCVGAAVLLALAHSAPSAAEGEHDRMIRGGPFSLVAHTGREVTDRDFRGKFMLIYFGYTSCPDVCPLGLQVVSEAMRALAEQEDRVQPLFISFDPSRDTVERLAHYLHRFHPRILGLTGTKEQTLAAANAYGVNVSAAYAEKPRGYSMNHSSFTYLVGPDGRLRLMFRDGVSPRAMADAIRKQLGSQPQTAAE